MVMMACFLPVEHGMLEVPACGAVGHRSGDGCRLPGQAQQHTEQEEDAAHRLTVYPPHGHNRFVGCVRARGPANTP